MYVFKIFLLLPVSLNVGFFSVSFLMVIYFEREREGETKQGRGRETGRQRIPSRLSAVSAEPDGGLNPTNHGIRT